MATEQTETSEKKLNPKKVPIPQCIACFKKKVWRKYDVGGTKWKRHKVKDKLLTICGGEVYSAILEEKVGFCHACLHALDNSFTFAEKIRENISRLGSLPEPEQDNMDTNNGQDKAGMEQNGVQVFLEENIFSQWRQLAKKLRVVTDTEVARHLLKCYKSKSTPATGRCKSCEGRLTLCCPSCWQKRYNPSGAPPVTQQMARVTSVAPITANFGCMFPEKPPCRGRSKTAAGNSFFSPLRLLLENPPDASSSTQEVEQPLDAASATTKPSHLQQQSPPIVVVRKDAEVDIPPHTHNEHVPNPMEPIQQNPTENFSCMFPFMKEPGQQLGPSPPEQRPLPPSSEMSMEPMYVQPTHVWTGHFSDNVTTINPRALDGKVSFNHTPLMPTSKESEQQPTVPREDLAASNTLLELFQSDPPATQPNPPKKKVRRRRVPTKTDKSKPYICRECSMSFVTSSSLRRHMLIHTGEKPFKCTHCGDAFRQSNGLKRHVLAVHSGNRTHKCKRCQACFPSYRELIEHRQSSAHIKGKVYYCEDCGKAFRKISALKAHAQTNCETTEGRQKPVRNKAVKAHILRARMRANVPRRLYTCRVCGETSGTIYEAQKHKFSAHPELDDDVRSFTYSERGKCYTSQLDAKPHPNIHSGEKPFVCKQCGAAFRSPTNLHMHEKIHTAIRKYSCEHCGLKFRTLPHLKKHLTLHEGDELFPCPECGVSFNSKRYLTTHRHTHEKTDKRRFVCEMCGAKQWTATALRHHMLTHTGEKPFVCEICGAAFTWSSGLKYHMRYHDNKNCVCEVCGAGFIWKSELKQHMETHPKTTGPTKVEVEEEEDEEEYDITETPDEEREEMEDSGVDQKP